MSSECGLDQTLGVWGLGPTHRQTWSLLDALILSPGMFLCLHLLPRPAICAADPQTFLEGYTVEPRLRFMTFPLRHSLPPPPTREP